MNRATFFGCIVLAACGVQAAETPLLVPAPRHYAAGIGQYAVTSILAHSETDWYDFDRVGQCLKESRITRRTDPQLPKEGYTLDITPAGIAIASADDAGDFYARQTLRQLVTVTGTNSIALPCCSVRDWPAYAWRGFLLDDARHFLGKGVLMRLLDQMAAHKYNVFHWHLTDDQGWRVEIKRHPELVTYGARRPKSVKFGAHARWLPPAKELEYEFDSEPYGPFYYTQDDVREILAYAKARHITVIPEIELPGHVRAFLAAYPHCACFPETIAREPRCLWSIEKDVLCVGNPEGLRLFCEIFDEICELFPDSPIIHIGGDECPRVNWKSCPKCQALLREKGRTDETGLQAYITSAVVRYLEKKGRRAIGWDEILAGDVPVSAIGMTWRTSVKGGAGTTFVSAVDAVTRGHDMVMCPSDYCYIEKRQGLAHDPYPYYSPWKGEKNVITLAKAYDFDPSRGIPESARAHILGGQANLWGESIFNVFDLEWKAWPRACALAEVLWLGADKPGWEDFHRRMQAHRLRLLDAGVNCAPLE